MIIPVNVVIILKEILLEFFSLNMRRKGIQESLNLGFSDIYDPILRTVYYFLPSARPNKN
jgi:hypothetical protein